MSRVFMCWSTCCPMQIWALASASFDLCHMSGIQTENHMPSPLQFEQRGWIYSDLHQMGKSNKFCTCKSHVFWTVHMYPTHLHMYTTYCRMVSHLLHKYAHVNAHIHLFFWYFKCEIHVIFSFIQGHYHVLNTWDLKKNFFVIFSPHCIRHISLMVLVFSQGELLFVC